MKLLTRNTRYYLLISIIVFMAAGLTFYQMLDRIFQKELDATLTEEKLLIEETINFSDSVPDFRPIFGHMIDITILNSPQHRSGFIHDTLMYDSEPGSFHDFRHLREENTSLKGKGYIINIYKPLREYHSLITRIILALGVLFLVLIILLVLFNYFIARRIWIPFHRTISSLTHYDINRDRPLKFNPSSTEEFQLLNTALEKMSEKIHQDYLNLREFNANAAHELMTPVAVIKSRLELLVQQEGLDEGKMQLISGVFDALTRMSKLLQGLLLISKIENNQYEASSTIRLDQVILRTLEHFNEMIGHKNLVVTRNLNASPCLEMNASLAEILVSNLLSNAIRHNVPDGSIEISLEEHQFTVINTGPEPKTDPAELFERFRKSGNNPDSIGLGLSIVQKIAGRYGMQVTYSFSDGFHILNVLF